MKIKTGFVTNSSSTSFLIYSKNNKKLTIKDFILEIGKKKLEEFIDEYDWYSHEMDYTWEKMKEEAESYSKCKIGSNIIQRFGDEDRTIVGHVFDYMLREGGESENFIWEYYESNR